VDIDRWVFIVCFIGIPVSILAELKARLCIVLTRAFEWVPWLVRICVFGRNWTTHHQTVYVLGRIELRGPPADVEGPIVRHDKQAVLNGRLAPQL
jgi:hypothetical protein